MKRSAILQLALVAAVGCSKINGELINTPADSDAGFNFPYLLFMPQEISQDSMLYLIVEPNNTGFTSDDFDDHLESAENLATNSGNIGNFLSHQLGYPLLVPVFPRSKENWRVYSHALDRDVMLQKENDMARIDLQLIAMAEDAGRKLRERGFTVQEDLLMTGFSASGTFANRFAALHPDKVAAYAAGGLNGILIMPAGKAGDTPLDYPLGTNDLREITGRAFDAAGFRQTAQFLFMGELDDNDAASYGDAYDDMEREIIYTLFEKEMSSRWEKYQQHYQSHNINAVLKTYPGTGHEPSKEIKEDILTFFKKNIKK